MNDHRSYVDNLKELSHGIFSNFGHVKNYLQIEGNLKIVVF